MINAPLFPNDWILMVADYVIVFEDNFDTGDSVHSGYGNADSFTARCDAGRCGVPTWWKTNGNRIAHTVDGVADQATFNQVVSLSRTRGGASFYAYDRQNTMQSHFFNHLTLRFPAMRSLWAAAILSAIQTFIR